MKSYDLTQSELRFAELIWGSAPIASMELVKLAETEMQWKKSTTFTMLRNLCKKGIFKNENAVVSTVISKDELLAKQSRNYIEDAFGGSLPRFITSFYRDEKMSDKQAEELMRLIAEHKEG